jgi:hypothetical protein
MSELTFTPFEWGLVLAISANRQKPKKMPRYNPARLYQGETKLTQTGNARNERRTQCTTK